MIYKGVDNMTIGEKIKFYRKELGITQATLSELSQLNLSTIKKLESDIMNPKPKMLKQVADALGVSMYIFTDFDISTVSDVISLLTKMDENIDLQIEADMDSEGNPIPDSVRLHFGSHLINEKLCMMLKAKKIQNELIKDRNTYTDDANTEALDRIDKSLEEIRLDLCTGANIVTEDFKGNAVKVYPVQS